MESKINRASHFLIGVSRDTRLWGIGVIIGAILLSVSFFMDPIEKEFLIQSKTVSAEEKATAGTGADNLNVNSIYAEDKAAGMQKSSTGNTTYIENESNIILNENEAISLEDFNALCKIVHAEAGIEDMEGQILIANVILNRVKSDIFPDDIQSVITQSGQFEPVTRGVYERTNPSKMSREAVMSALNGEDYSEGALYFQKSESKIWNDYQYLFRHGNHSFYK